MSWQFGNVSRRQTTTLRCQSGNLSYHGIDLHTVTAGHIDQVKDGVTALLGAIFLKNLVVKTLRGMAAAVAAGWIAGGRSYGYESKKLYDKDGVRIHGYLEIAPVKADVVRRIYGDFASDLSSIQITKPLNDSVFPGHAESNGTPPPSAAIPSGIPAFSTTRFMLAVWSGAGANTDARMTTAR